MGELTHADAKAIDTLNLALKSELSAMPRAFGGWPHPSMQRWNWSDRSRDDAARAHTSRFVHSKSRPRLQRLTPADIGCGNVRDLDQSRQSDRVLSQREAPDSSPLVQYECIFVENCSL